MESESIKFSTSHAETLRLHRKQAGLQIFLPIILITLVALGVIVFLIVISLRPNGAATHIVWADISTIWLLLPLILLSIFPAALLVGLIFGFSKLIRGLPQYGALGQYYAQRMVDEVRKIADKAAQPAIQVGGWKAGWQRLRNLLRAR